MIFYRWQLVVLGICFAMLIGLIGSYDYDQALQDAALYCDMTTEGRWPAYDKAIDCSYQDDGEL